jgi:type VI secretion system secreted protein VgrG
MAGWTQDGKVASVTTVLGKDQFLLEQFSATEHISNPFEIVVEGLTPAAVDFTSQLGTGAAVAVQTLEGAQRNFHGLLCEAMSLGPAEGMVRYRLTLRPWFFLLTLGRDTKIFQAQTVKDIITSLFEAAGFTDYSMKMTTAGLTAREYCVQFRESRFDFISRLMEEEGIYYYFEHTDSKHTMVLCDGPNSHSDSPQSIAVVRGAPDDNRGALWTWDQRLRPGIVKATLHDSNLYLPGQNLEAVSAASGLSPAEKAEFYDYPGGYAYHATDGSETGAAYAAVRLQEGRRAIEIWVGEGEVMTVATGLRVTMQDANGPTDGREFLVVGASHSVRGQTYGGIRDSEAHISASMDFEAAPSATTWRPARVTPKPVVGGLQTAFVVGASGDVITTDQYGRVKVQFDWDRLGQNNETSSCWLRVSQSSADKTFGHVVLPRIGEEVLVDFLDGDPDRPIITGRVYNAKNTVPYGLPDEKTKSTWKSQTIGASGSYDGAETQPSGTGFNEIRFEDKGGSEEVFVHAQRLFTSQILLDETRTTGRDTSARSGRNRTISVKNNLSTTLDEGDETRTLTQGSRTSTINKNDSLTLQTGNYSLSIDAGQATIEAAQSITLKVGGNQIVINQQGVQITGIMVQITADATLTAQGLQTELKADAMMTIGGALVMIN